MQIVSQSALVSYSLFPPQRLLNAPPARLQICAPRIAGLLPARSSASKVETIPQKLLSRDDVLRQLGPIRSREVMNIEIADMALDALNFFASLHAHTPQRVAKEGKR